MGSIFHFRRKGTLPFSPRRDYWRKPHGKPWRNEKRRWRPEPSGSSKWVSGGRRRPPDKVSGSPSCSRETGRKRCKKRIVLFFTKFVNLSCFYSTPFTEAVSPSTVFERIPTRRFLLINLASYHFTSGVEFDQGYLSFFTLIQDVFRVGYWKKQGGFRLGISVGRSISGSTLFTFSYFRLYCVFQVVQVFWVDLYCLVYPK